MGLVMVGLSLWGLGARGLPFTERLFYMVLVHGALIIIPVFMYFYLTRRGRIRSHAGFMPALVLSVTGLAVMGGLAGLEMPYFNSMATEKPFIIQVRQLVARDGHAQPAYYRLGTRTRARLSFYLGRPGPVRNLDGPEALGELLTSGAGWFLVVQVEDRKELLEALKRYPRVSAGQILTERYYPWEGWPGRQEKQKAGKLCCIRVQASGWGVRTLGR